jgi:hypothetical protein
LADEVHGSAIHSQIKKIPGHIRNHCENARAHESVSGLHNFQGPELCRTIKTAPLSTRGREHVYQGQKFIVVMKAKNRGTATSKNAKNRGIIAAKIVKIAAKNVKIAALSRQMS